MEFYPAKLEWEDNECLLINETVRDEMDELPVDLCDVFYGSSIMTAIVIVYERNIGPLKELLLAGKFSAEITPVVQAMIEYAAKNLPMNGEYCFVCVEP